MSHREPRIGLPRIEEPGTSSAGTGRRVLGGPARVFAAACALFLAIACTGRSDLEQLRQEMYDQPKYEPLEASNFFADGRASRQPVKGTVARGQLDKSSPEYTGMDGDAYLKALPMPVDRALLDRGRERYNIFCSPCHDRAGTGNGIVVKRGFKQPPSYHIERLRAVEPGYIYDVISNGFGVMHSYGSRIPVDDRWAIAAYVRTLQLSQHAPLKDVPAAVREQLEAQKPEGAE